MKPIGIFLLALASHHQLCHSVRVPNQGVSHVWNHNYLNGGGRPKFITRADDDDDSKNSDSTKAMTDDETKTMRLRVPSINFYSNFPNALGFVGQGFLWIRELSAAIGTPLVIWIMAPAMLLAGIGLIFIPDLSQLGLPLFYAGPNNPDQGIFPPPDLLDVTDFADFDFVKQIKNVLPDGFLPRRGSRS